MKKMFSFILFAFIVAILFPYSNNSSIAYADELLDNVTDQLENIDLTELEIFFDENGSFNGNGFIDSVKRMLNGEYGGEYQSVLGQISSLLISDIKGFVPSLISIVFIAIICSLLQGVRSSFSAESISNIISFVGLLAIIFIVSSNISSLWQDCKNIIENIANLCAIMSPIITTLMIAGGANVSASLYSPAVNILSSLISNVMLNIALPLIGVMMLFSIISNFSTSVKLSKFADLSSSIIKWTLGITATVFTVFLSVQGITSATYDGISIKAAKYAISNSIPLVGGFIRDGFDLVIAGSVLIKNSVGLVCVFGVIGMILSPIIKMIVFSLILKTCSALVEPIADARISNFCMAISKCINYLIAVTLVVGLMFFITVLLMIFSANAFI